MIETLDRQREEKDHQRRSGREKEEQEYQKNMDYQNQLFQNRNGGNKAYEQNQRVYNYYKDIYQQKVRKDKDLEVKLVDNVQQREN